MNKLLIICALLALTAGCASPRKYQENHSAKELHQPDFLPDKAKENRFTKQFQQADSMFNEKCYSLGRLYKTHLYE